MCSESPVVVFTCDRLESVLVLREVRVKQAGLYKCVAEEELDVMRTKKTTESNQLQLKVLRKSPTTTYRISRVLHWFTMLSLEWSKKSLFGLCSGADQGCFRGREGRCFKIFTNVLIYWSKKITFWFIVF